MTDKTRTTKRLLIIVNPETRGHKSCANLGMKVLSALTHGQDEVVVRFGGNKIQGIEATDFFFEEAQNV